MVTINAGERAGRYFERPRKIVGLYKGGGGATKYMRIPNYSIKKIKSENNDMKTIASNYSIFICIIYCIIIIIILIFNMQFLIIINRIFIYINY